HAAAERNQNVRPFDAPLDQKRVELFRRGERLESFAVADQKLLRLKPGAFDAAREAAAVKRRDRRVADDDGAPRLLAGRRAQQLAGLIEQPGFDVYPIAALFEFYGNGFHTSEE